MAVKGAIAKANIANKLKEVFGEDWVGESGGKYYVWSYENGQKVQIAIAMTCPKTPIGADTIETLEFGDGTSKAQTPVTEITEQELDNVRKMMAALGL